MTDQENTCGAPAAGGSSMVVVKQSKGSKHKPYRPNDLEDEQPPELHHKRSHAPAVPSVPEVKAENSDLKEKKPIDYAVTSETQKQLSSELQKQVPSETQKQVSSETQKQVSSEKQKPVSSEIQKQVSSEMQKQVSSETRKQLSSEKQKQLSSEMQKQVSSEIQKQVSSVTQKQLSSETQKQVVAKKLSSTTERQAVSTETIPHKEMELKRVDIVALPIQPIPALTGPEVSDIPDVIEKKEEEIKEDDDSITEEIAELRTDEPIQKAADWSSDAEEAGGLPRSESRTSRVSRASRASRAMRRLLCCGALYEAPSEDNMSSMRDYHSGI